jgi:ABC-type glycerol-3-phosphate transport system permease component
MIPRYIIIARTGLVDNFLVHILPNLAMPVGLFLVKQFIDQIPDSLIEAAKLDGANDWFIYVKIILPLTKPAIATIAILSFQTAWSSVEASNFYINQERLKNFAYYMSTLTSSTSAVAGQGVAAAAGLIMFLPSLVIFIFTQSKVMNTMAHSGIK